MWRAGRWYSIPVGPDDCSPRVFKNGGSFGRSNHRHRALNSKTRTIRSVTSCKRKKAIVNTSAPKHSRLVPCSDRSPELKSVSRHREWCLFVLGIFAIKFVLLIVDPLPKYYLGDSFSYIYTATSGWIPPDRSYFYGYVIRWLALWTGSLTPLLIVQVCLGGIVAIVAAWICWTIFELPSWASIFLLTCTGYPSQQALNRRRIDRKPGMRSSMQTARRGPAGTRRKRNSAASSETLLVLFCQTSTLRT